MFNIASVAFKRLFVTSCTLLFISMAVQAQDQPAADSALSLDQCVAYALKHEPMINMALVNEAITRSNNRIATAGWLPQVNVQGNLTHYNTLPTGFFTDSGRIVNSRTGVVNTFTPTLAVTQMIFNPALLYAVHSAPLYVKQSQQITDSTKIEIVAAVSKTFYSLLNTLEQINVLREDTARLNKNVSDTYHQFVSGVADKTNYDEAVISLNNSMFSLKQASESIRPQYAQLKQVMGYPPAGQFNVNRTGAGRLNISGCIRHFRIRRNRDRQQIRRCRFAQLALRKKTTPLEYLVRVHPMCPRNLGYARSRLHRQLHNRQLL